MDTFKEIRINHIPAVELMRMLVNKRIQFNQYAHILFDDPSFIYSGNVEKLKMKKI